MNFGKWNFDENSESCSRRLKRAVSAECTPLGIVKEIGYAVFSGSHGIYNTTLDTCNCYDCTGSSVPCKHILRLAMEMGLINMTYDSDLNAVKYPHEKITVTKNVFVDANTGEILDANSANVVKGIFNDLTFVITGTFPSYTRSEIEEIINKAGGRVSGSISRRTSYLIVGDEPGSKLDKAKEYGMSIISAEELLDMIKQG